MSTPTSTPSGPRDAAGGSDPAAKAQLPGASRGGTVTLNGFGSHGGAGADSHPGGLSPARTASWRSGSADKGAHALHVNED